jgi:hypothetical protein
MTILPQAFFAIGPHSEAAIYISPEILAKNAGDHSGREKVRT